MLGELLAGRRVEYAPFSAIARRREGRRVVDPTPLVVSEGITLLLGSIVAQRLAALRVYVHAPPEVRVARQLARLADEGHYRDMRRHEVERRIVAKGSTEDPLIEQQIAR